MITKEEQIELNKKQKEFYNTKQKNLATKLWHNVRNVVLHGIKSQGDITSEVYEIHKEWLGDLSQKRVLDFGCFSGNYLTGYIASNSKEYVAIDLSDKAIGHLESKLKHLPNAKFYAADFLSNEDFPESNFDVIYAYGVLHHFENLEVLTQKLKEKLNDDGVIISYDPLETSVPIKILRVLYRPFQSDKEWEWPFKRSTYRFFEQHFKIDERIGILGKTKWFVVYNLLPLSKAKKAETLKKWHKSDIEKSKISNTYLFRCMHLTMKMTNRN